MPDTQKLHGTLRHGEEMERLDLGRYSTKQSPREKKGCFVDVDDVESYC